MQRTIQATIALAALFLCGTAAMAASAIPVEDFIIQRPVITGRIHSDR